jgi:carbon monoxide dehydrogenase subunit G
MRICEAATLRSSPDAVWAALADWERQASWMPDVAWVRVVGGERELGASIEVRTKVLGIPFATDVLTVTAWEPRSRIAVNHQGVVAGTGEWRLEPVGEGTRFIWIEEIRMPPPVLGDIALWLYGPIQRWMIRRSLRNLARLAERSGPEPG